MSSATDSVLATPRPAEPVKKDAPGRPEGVPTQDPQAASLSLPGDGDDRPFSESTITTPEVFYASAVHDAFVEGIRFACRRIEDLADADPAVRALAFRIMEAQR